MMPAETKLGIDDDELRNEELNKTWMPYPRARKVAPGAGAVPGGLPAGR